MRKLLYLFMALYFGVNFTSCTPEALVENVKEQACCGDDIPPDPPPPPPGNGGG